MSYRLFRFGASRVLDRARGLRTCAGAFVIACAACLIPFAASAAGFTVTPTNLVFGSKPLGATGTIAVTITNTSGVSQTPNFSGGAPNDPTNFGSSQNCAGVPLAAGGSCQFTYTFTPKTLGAHSSSTTIGINADNFSITMSGTGISAFSVAPTNLAFGNAPLGATKTIAVTITNTSGVSQTPNFSGGAPNDPTNFGGSQNCAGVPLAAGGSCQFTYTFSPKTLGAHSSSTTIGIGSENFSITMSGTGISAFSVAPTNLVFGSVPIGATGTIAVTITNTSGVSQTPNFSGGAPIDPTNFGGSQNCAGVPLAAGGSCQFTYTFSPKTLGAHSSSTTIGINSETFSITMSGTGGGITVAPTTIDFGPVSVGTVSAAMSVTMTNVSGAPLGPLSVSGGAPAAPFGATQNCAGVTLAAGGTCKFSYTFTPTAPGVASGSSNFTINGGAFSVSLSGTGTPALELNQHGLTGSWYEAATSGQGIEVEVFPNSLSGTGSAFLSWFTYDTTIGGPERQRWYTAQGSVVTGLPNASLTIFQNTGGNFNAPPATTAQMVGTATVSFATCTSGQLTYNFTDGTNRTGTIPLTRLMQNVTCSTTTPNATNADFALSGNWFGGATTSGQGFTVEVNPLSGAFFLAWYTYLPNGAAAGAAGQRWFTAQGPFTPGMRSIPVTIFQTTGGVFDTPTSPGQNTVAVGTGTMAFQSCSAATFSYTLTGGSSSGLSGVINLSRVGPVPPGCAP